mmetsp:Transcript_94943/g.245190  ORF Transcript_94943/g.245190 Transcript_94943/m.245190 type:complete len:87 (-) Transcript_94943:671-931(-)
MPQGLQLVLRSPRQAKRSWTVKPDRPQRIARSLHSEPMMLILSLRFGRTTWRSRHRAALTCAVIELEQRWVPLLDPLPRQLADLPP